MRTILGWAVGVAVSTASPLVRAESNTPRLVYEGPASCPAEADFSAQVAARTPLFDQLGPDFRILVKLDATGGDVRGEVTFERVGTVTVREVHAADCDAVVRALALIVSILVDPQANEPRASAPNASASAQASPAANAAAPPPPEASERWPLSAGVELAMQTAIAPDVAFGERLFFGVARGSATAWASSLRLSIARIAANTTSPTSAASAALEVAEARLDFGLVRFSHRMLNVEACPFLVLGRLRAMGAHPAGSVTHDLFWPTLGLALRPSLIIARHLVVTAAVGPYFPLESYSFAFSGEAPLYETARVGLDAALGVGVRFP
jgi:hypothetical protein